MAEFHIGRRRYPTKTAARNAVQEIRDRYSVGDKVDRLEDQELLRDLLDLHQNADDKIGCGVADFVVAQPLRGKHPGFDIIRIDGTRIDFSFLKCLKPPDHRQQVLAAMRAEVELTVNDYFDTRKANGSLRSDKSGTALSSSAAHVSYFQGPPFVVIATEFAGETGGWDAIELTPSAKAGCGMFVDRALALRWHGHHEDRAVLGLLTPEENLRRPRERPEPPNP